MRQYYFIHLALPELVMGSPPGIAFSEVMQLFRDNISDLDWSAVCTLLEIIDLTNVYYYLTQQPLDSRGILSPFEIEESILGTVHFPEYFTRFLEKHIEPKARIENFSEVYLDYFEIQSVNSSGFIRNYLKFEMNLRLHLAMSRSRKLGREHREILINQETDLYKTFLYKKEFEDMSLSLSQVEGRPFEEYQIIQQYRCNTLQNMRIEAQPFSLDGLLVYMMQLLIIEDDTSLSEIRGQRAMQQLIEASA